MKRNITDRTVLRNFTEVAITCQTLSSGNARVSEGVMHNFSSEGLYIETTGKYLTGTILIMRMVDYPNIPTSMGDEGRPRSLSLAEVIWRQQLVDENTIRFAMGLKYLD